MSKKICNQFFVKDIYRDMRYNGTMRCSCCGDNFNITLQFPFSLSLYKDMIDTFIRLHTVKGCNQNEVKPGEWASGEIKIAIA